jgi:hypothetical protein
VPGIQRRARLAEELQPPIVRLKPDTTYDGVMESQA